ncbi:hypothetical protein INS49_007380 [Diaporthe citri]|uniref:uncharacterized protein n=1 Tax=Diaporthe citri TaxID=83186 RepID=UPI001C7E21E7|nr:uncharacterized protein INS49_007380 [Diaporthe citri]KAG6365769.1 hypothetical protein INS49_007380 [Diaporthe citri]
MPKLTYQVENAPGRIYGKNSNELVFKEPSRNAVIYSTSTETGWVKSAKKHLWRGQPSEKDGGICIATIDEPSHATLAVHPSRTAEAGAEEAESSPADEKAKLKLKSTWFGSNNRTVTFRDVTYTWTGTSKITDKDGKVVAKMAKPWFYQGKLGDLEIDVDEGDEGREVLEMVLATYVQRWWEEKAKAVKAAEEAKEQKAKEKKAAQVVAKSQKQQEKKEGDKKKAEAETQEPSL